jgi:hypothetical protein
VTTADLTLIPSEILHYRRVMREHANSERYGCAICHKPNCDTWSEAKMWLELGGRLREV